MSLVRGLILNLLFASVWGCMTGVNLKLMEVFFDLQVGVVSIGLSLAAALAELGILGAIASSLHSRLSN